MEDNKGKINKGSIDIVDSGHHSYQSRNSSLHNAQKNKNDEFYTQLCDIEKELKNYKEHFKDKVVYCNCDDPKESNFYVYFSNNFEHLGLKKLICTHYDGG